MTFLLGLLTKLGLGGLFSWLSGGVFSSLAGIIVAAATQALEVLGIVLKWFVKTFITGVDHIVKSVPAIIVVLSLSWAGYGYGKYVVPVQQVRAVEKEKAPKTGEPVKREREETPEWMDKVWGN